MKTHSTGREVLAAVSEALTAWGAPEIDDERSLWSCPPWEEEASYVELPHGGSVLTLVVGHVGYQEDITVSLDPTADADVYASLENLGYVLEDVGVPGISVQVVGF